jgi:putative hydrolase of the HAD superfamily
LFCFHVPKLPSPVWLFDLDNTLHDASHAIFPAISANMNTYIARVLGDGVTPASQEAVDAARLGYWKRYGATLLGMIRHHRVDAADFLRRDARPRRLHEWCATSAAWNACCAASRAARSC